MLVENKKLEKRSAEKLNWTRARCVTDSESTTGLNEHDPIMGLDENFVPVELDGVGTDLTKRILKMIERVWQL